MLRCSVHYTICVMIVLPCHRKAGKIQQRQKKIEERKENMYGLKLRASSPERRPWGMQVWKKYKGKKGVECERKKQ